MCQAERAGRGPTDEAFSPVKSLRTPTFACTVHDPNHEGSILHNGSCVNCKTATVGNDVNVRGRIPQASIRTLISQRLLFDVISAPRRGHFSSSHDHTLLSSDINFSRDLKSDHQNHSSQSPTHALRADLGVSCWRMRLTAAPRLKMRTTSLPEFELSARLFQHS